MTAVNIGKQHPITYQKLVALSTQADLAMKASGLDPLLAEQVTKLPNSESRGWDEDALTREQVSAVAWLSVVMNAWNRVAVTSHYPVGP